MASGNLAAWLETWPGIVIPGEKAVVLNQYDLNATIKPSLKDINYATLQTGKFEIIMTSTDLTGKVAVKSLEIPWSRAFKTTPLLDADALNQFLVRTPLQGGGRREVGNGS